MVWNSLYDKTVDVYNAKEALPLIVDKLKHAGKGRVSNRKPYYYDICCSFDIETTTVKNTADGATVGGKYSHFNYCYVWQCCFDGLFVMGRHVNEWFDLVNEISNAVGGGRVLCYVHNLAYEYNNLADYFIDNCSDLQKDFFFKNAVHPLYIRNGIFEYRCSYQLTHKSLDRLSKEVGLYKSGDLEYTKDRHSETPLTEEEVEYCLRDVYNLWVWLEREKANYCKSIHKRPHYCYMPLTQTGYVRYDIRHGFSNTERGRWFLKDNEMTEAEYNIVHAAFRGGDTHAAYYHICKEFNGGIIRHRDFTSAYPAKLVLEKFVTKGLKERQNPTLDDVSKFMLMGFAVIATYDLRDVALKPNQTSYIPVSCCQYVSPDAEVENGRVMTAEQVILTVTEVDLSVIADTYDFNIAGVSNMLYGRKDYLPVELVKIVLEYFRRKTVYKHSTDADEVVEYALSKQKLNGIFGMASQRLTIEEIAIDPDTLYTEVNGTKYEQATVLPYHIGAYVTAYLRADLSDFKTFLCRTRDFVYCDTDSIFYRENQAFEEYVAQYNEHNRKRLEELAERIGDYDLVMPKDRDGKRQYLGEFLADDDYIIDRFITCGAKRYVTERQDKNGKRVDMTFSGVGDTKAEYDTDTGRNINGLNVQYIEDKYGDIFNALAHFDEHPIYIPYREDAGKMTHYIERGNFIGQIDDGRTTQTVTARASMVLVPIDITLSLEPTLADLLIYNKVLWTTY